MDINKHQVYTHWLDELSAISEEEFFPILGQFLNLLLVENSDKIKKLEEAYDKEYVQLNKCGEEAINELEPLLNKIENEARKVKMPLSTDANRYKQIKKGEMLTSESLPDALYHAIRTTLEGCRNGGKLKMFDDLMSDRDGFWYLDYDKACGQFPKYQKYQVESREFDKREKEEIWGVYHYLKWSETFFREIFPEEAGTHTKPELINKLKRLVLHLLTPEENSVENSETNFSNTAPKQDSGEKRDVLRAIWEVYESHSRPDCILVPVAKLTTEGREVGIIDSVIEVYREEGLFKNWERKDRWYNLEFIDHMILPNRYREMEKIGGKLTTVYQREDEVDGLSDAQQLTSKPHCFVDGGIGYLKFGKYGPKKRVGSATGRPFQFLQSILSPLGVYKTVDAMMGAIWKEKDNKDQLLINPNTTKARKVQIIKNSCIKELQKGKKLDRRIKFEFNDAETQLRAVLIE